MKISGKGLAHIKQSEGCRLKAYQDPVGVWTIGYGHTSHAGEPIVRRGMTVTQDDAEAILSRDIFQYEAAVFGTVRPRPTQCQFDAMVSLCYNIGPTAFANSSVVRFYNKGDMRSAADAFRKWCKAGGRTLPGLIARREAERTLFLSKIEEPPAETQKPPVAARPIAGKPEAGAGAVAAGGAVLAHYMGVGLAWIGAMLAGAVIAWIAWQAWQAWRIGQAKG